MKFWRGGADCLGGIFHQGVFFSVNDGTWLHVGFAGGVQQEMSAPLFGSDWRLGNKPRKESRSLTEGELRLDGAPLLSDAQTRNPLRFTRRQVHGFARTPGCIAWTRIVQSKHRYVTLCYC
jgi:hypothetical protein